MPGTEMHVCGPASCPRRQWHICSCRALTAPHQLYPEKVKRVKDFPQESLPKNWMGNVPRPRGPGPKGRARRKNKKHDAVILPPRSAGELPPASLKLTHGCIHVCTWLHTLFGEYENVSMITLFGEFSILRTILSNGRQNLYRQAVWEKYLLPRILSLSDELITQLSFARN